MALRTVAAGIRQRLAQLAELEVRDNGKPLPEALWDLGDAAGCFDYYADLAEKAAARAKRRDGACKYTSTSAGYL